jgi:iron complex transport system substrate-binding protein
MKQLQPVLAALAALLLCGAAPRPPMSLGPKPAPNPQRVVTLAPSLTELVIALGAGNRLVGVTRFDDAAEVRALPRVGGYVDPSVEAVASLRPDLVLVEPSPGNRAAVERIAALGNPVLAVPLGTQEEILAAMTEVASALGARPRGEALRAETERRLAQIAERAKRLPKVRALVVYDWDPLVVAGPGSFPNRLLEEAGGINTVTEAQVAYPIYSAERAMRTAPDVIIDASDVHDPPRERILKLPGLASARVEVTTPSLFRPGPRIGDALEELFRELHPQPAAPRAAR